MPSLSCRIGVHHGSWDYVGPEDCRQIHICRTYGAQGYRVRHHLGHWTIHESKDTGNIETSVCLRCNVRLERFTTPNG